VSIKVTVRLVKWLARIDRAVSNNAATRPTRPLYNLVYMRSLIVLAYPVLTHLMKDTSAVSCVCNSAQYACSAHIHIKDTQSQRRYRCRNSEILSSVLIEISLLVHDIVQVGKYEFMPDCIINVQEILCAWGGGELVGGTW
jgi:hypothetical protein